MSELLIFAHFLFFGERCEWFAHDRSFPLSDVSDREQIAQVAHQNEEMSESLIFLRESLIRSFLGKKRAICSENRWANAQPWLPPTKMVKSGTIRLAFDLWRMEASDKKNKYLLTYNFFLVLKCTILTRCMIWQSGRYRLGGGASSLLPPACGLSHGAASAGLWECSPPLGRWAEVSSPLWPPPAPRNPEVW